LLVLSRKILAYFPKTDVTIVDLPVDKARDFIQLSPMTHIA